MCSLELDYVNDLGLRCEDIFHLRFERDHSVWVREEEGRAEQTRRREEEERRAREEEARLRAIETASIEKDRQVAVWHQAQMDAEARGLPPPPPLAAPSSSPPVRGSIGHAISMESQRPQYDPGLYEDSPSAPPSYSAAVPSAPTIASPSPPPSYDRCTKPSLPSTSSLPTFDRSSKPPATASGLRTVVVPGDLMDTFLRVALSNSSRGIETLGTLGGSLCQDRLVISHLVIPRQTGKPDSCTMEGLEDVWEVHDSESIIFLGWIHTHPEYDVFLSSVDMHNQYEWQHMLPEALAIVCSIKFSSVGFLSLTQAGLQEIGACDQVTTGHPVHLVVTYSADSTMQVNFHPHSKEPPLFEEARHVEVDSTSKVILKDLR